MSYGMRIWGADGALQLSEDSFTMRVVYSAVVSLTNAKEMQTFSVPGLTPSNGTAFVIPIGSYAEYDTQYETEVINDAVRVYNYNRGFGGAWYSSVKSMRLIAVRFA
jgi:hypothetical protein